jgi:phenylpropionate dioxygenase-like ring-hydroxylating dioxygenase large terminal subunit
MTDTLARPAAGEARCPGTSFGDLIAADTKPAPDFIRDEVYEYLGSAPLRADRYTSPAFFQQEVEKMWPNVWQFAAREEDMPDVGDVVVYENAGRSYLVTRQPDGSVRAFHNVCLHRGRKLRLDSGWSPEFKCPFHGFTWNTDGSLKEIPCRWDFGHLSDKQMQLPEAQVGRWAGYIFLKENPGGPTLEEFLSPLPDHFTRWNNERRATVVNVGKVIHANWKAVSEAFMEAWHSVTTHPQILPFTGDANTRYNIYGDHVNVALTPFAVMSPHVADSGNPEQWIIDQFLKFNGRAGGPGPEGRGARRRHRSRPHGRRQPRAATPPRPATTTATRPTRSCWTPSPTTCSPTSPPGAGSCPTSSTAGAPGPTRTPRLWRSASSPR